MYLNTRCRIELQKSKYKIVPCGTINIQVYKNLQKYLQCQIVNIQNSLQNYLLFSI